MESNISCALDFTLRSPSVVVIVYVDMYIYPSLVFHRFYFLFAEVSSIRNGFQKGYLTQRPVAQHSVASLCGVSYHTQCAASHRRSHFWEYWYFR